MKFLHFLILLGLTILVRAESKLVASNVIQCANAQKACGETALECGMAGASGNWRYDQTSQQCYVSDCNKLRVSDAVVSTQACTSCNTSGSTSASNYGGDVYANRDGNACVSVDCYNLAAKKKMTTRYCVICVGAGSTVNNDQQTCTQASNTSLLTVIDSIFLAYLFII